MKNNDQVLKQMIIKFFFKNKPRNDEPICLIQLNGHYNKMNLGILKRKVKQKMNQKLKKVTARINHKNQHWQTENIDNFRKIEKLKIDDSQIYVQSKYNSNFIYRIKNIAKSCECQNNKLQCNNQYKLPLQWNPKQQSAYRDNYQVKGIKDQNQLIYQLEQNNQNFKGKYKVQHPLSGFYYGESKKYEDVASSEEEEEELNDQENDGEVQKMTKKFINKAKSLDPNNLKDSEKLKRRKERIKNFKERPQLLLHILVNQHDHEVHMDIIIQNQQQEEQDMNNIYYHIMFNHIEIKMIHIIYKHIRMHQEKEQQQQMQNQNHLEIVEKKDRLNPEQVQLLHSNGKQVIPDFNIKKPDLCFRSRQCNR
ncbi:unnamed protein product [Paramecium sonneborni]|uniref:Uncharacterized protein n=1 Tax=Paramecium sonneborni TaxID=65129 RepID=A0A8S1Q5L3_9CILI|nr:unnamed protein product [Paramecium sonneborni]